MPTDTTGWPCALYAAVSKEEQADPNLPSIPDQLARDEVAAKQHGWPVVERIAIEGHSRNYRSLEALCRDCPEYAHLVELVTTRQIKVIVAVRYDRLGRKFSLIAALADLCSELEVYPYVLDQPVEPGPGQDLARLWLTAIGGTIVETDNRLRVSNYRMGQRSRVTKLGLSNATTAPYGYTRAGSGKDVRFAVRWDQAVHVQYIFMRRREGASYPQIAAELNAQGVSSPQGADTGFSPKTIAAILRNIFYIGKVRWREWRRRTDGRGKECIAAHEGQGLHEAIVDQPLWDDVQRINGSRTRLCPNSSGQTYLFSGLLRCGHCGDSMSHYRRPNRPRTPVCVRCSRRLRMGKKSADNPRGCIANNHPEWWLREKVLAWIQGKLADPERFVAELEAQARDAGRDARAEALRHELAGLEKRARNVAAILEEQWTDLTADERDHYNDRRRALAGQVTKVRAELDGLQASERRIAGIRATLEQFAQFHDQLGQFTDAEWRPIIHALVRRIVVYRDRDPEIIPQ